MTASEVSPTATVVLDGSGNGQCSLGPPSGTKWALRLATGATSSASRQPQLRFYRGSSTGPLQLLDNTYTGSAASSAKVGGAIYYPGQLLWAVWTGGDPGAVATLQAFGQQAGRTDPLPASPLGEGFANPVVSQLIVGTPGAAQVIINATPIPTELVTYYQAAPLGTNPQTVVEVDLYYDGHGNYTYRALVIDSAATPVTNLVTGANVAGTVNEASRFALNPGVVLGNARFQQFFEENILILTSATGSTTILAAQAAADAFHRFSISRDGALGWGTGAALTDVFMDRVGVGNVRIGSRLDITQFGVGTDTCFACGLDGEANPRAFIRANGEHRWSDGTNASDTILSRQAAGVLQTLGDFAVSVAGKGLRIAEGANAKMGTAVLVGGTKVVNTTAVTANSRIFLTSQVDGGTPGFQRVTARVAGTSFTITSSNGADTSTVAWLIVEPA